MKNKRPVIIGGSILVAVIVALLVIPSFIDWSKYQNVAKQKLHDATGYDLTIGGNMRMAILPSPHANINSVSVSKPAAGRDDTFLTFEKAEVRLALLPLLVGKVEVASVTLEKPVVNLITYKDGSDNYTPVKPVAVQTPGETATGQPAAAEVTDNKGQSIAISGIHIKDGRVAMRNDMTGSAHEIGIKDLHIKADTLSGPFDGDGDITYGQADFDVSLNTGGYRAGETLPVQLNIADKDGRAELKWSGVAATGATKEIQGELNASFSDLASLLADISMPAAVPALGDKAQLSGMVTINPDYASLTNGKLQIGKTKFAAKAEATGMKTDAMAVKAILETNDLLDVDAFVKVADKTIKEEKKDAKKEEKATTTPAKKSYTLLPADFALPPALKGDIQIRARGLKYKGENTGPFDARMTAADGKGDARATLADIPGGGNLSLSASTAAKGTIEGAIIGSVSSLEKVLSDWLDLVDAKTLQQPGMPKRIDADALFSVTGNQALLTLKTLSLGEPKVSGTVGYTAAARPMVNAKLAINLLTLPQSEAEAKAAKKEEGKKADAAPAKVDFDFNPPQLPFDLKFDVAVGRLVKGDFVVTDVKAAGAYDGKGLTLSGANGTVNGGTISASGSVADLKALSGIDAQAGLRTSDLESFVQAMTGKPLALKQKIGDFAGSVKAKGDRKKMAIDAQAQAQGFTINANGTLDDPFSPEIPGIMNIRIRHNDLTSAIRAFSPGFGNTIGGTNKPVDISGTAKINGQVYEFADMKGVLGKSDIAGSLKADLSGSVPQINADINSKVLDVGSLVGVDSKAPAGTASGTGATTGGDGGAANSGQWSREPLDTGFMRSAAIDIKLNAGTLAYGTWVLTDAKGSVDMKNGTIKAPVSGKLYGGSIDATLNADSAGTGQPLNMAFKADVNDVAVGSFLQALTSSATKRADGTGSVNIDIKGSGASSAALMGSLAGSVKTKANTLVIYGMDIDKLAANLVEAFDGGWKGVLAGVTMQGFSGGQSKFKDIDHTFPIAGGNMPVKDFRLETTSSNAIIVTNGNVSFAQWNMDLLSNVQVTQPKDVPVISIRLAGPLNAPQKSVNSQALDNLVRAKIGNKVQDLVTDKLGKDSKAGALINQFLGGGQQAAPAPTPAPVTPATPDASATPAAPAPAAQEKTPEQQLLEGVLNKLSQ